MSFMVVMNFRKINACALSFGWQVDIDMMLQSLIDSCSGSEGIQLCADAACVLLELIKIIITKVSVSKFLNLLAWDIIHFYL